jgi:hypothetical protein
MIPALCPGPERLPARDELDQAGQGGFTTFIGSEVFDRERHTEMGPAGQEDLQQPRRVEREPARPEP